MSAMHEGEQRTVIRVECWECGLEYFVPIDSRGELESCPACEATDGQGVQGRRFTVTT